MVEGQVAIGDASCSSMIATTIGCLVNRRDGRGFGLIDSVEMHVCKERLGMLGATGMRPPSSWGFSEFARQNLRHCDSRETGSPPFPFSSF